MTIQLPQLSFYHFQFPDPQTALDDPDGLLAYGGDLQAERLVRAYQRGIFPWFSPDDPILWWSPANRGIIDQNSIHLPRSLKKALRKTEFRVTMNKATEHVIALCASTRSIEETWITDDMVDAYQELARAGICHSIEVWHNDELVGGLYGISMGQVFCGESMFSLVSDASKVGFALFQHHFFAHGGALIDCQLQNPHLQRFGTIEIPRDKFLSTLKELQSNPMPNAFYHAKELTNPWQSNGTKDEQ